MELWYAFMLCGDRGYKDLPRGRSWFLKWLGSGPGGPLVFEVGYHPRKKKKSRNYGCFSGPGNVRARTSFKGAKLEKRVCFWSY